MGTKKPECDSTKKVFCKVPRKARGMPKAQSPLKNNPTEQDDSNLTYQATIRNRHSYLYATQIQLSSVIQVYPRKTHPNRHPGLSHKNTWLSDLGSETPVGQIECARCNIIKHHLAHQKPLKRQFVRQVFLLNPLSKPADKFARTFLSITKVTELAEIPKIIRQIEHRCNNKVHIGILYKST